MPGVQAIAKAHKLSQHRPCMIRPSFLAPTAFVCLIPCQRMQQKTHPLFGVGGSGAKEKGGTKQDIFGQQKLS